MTHEDAFAEQDRIWSEMTRVLNIGGRWSAFAVAKRHYIDGDWTAVETLDYLTAEAEQRLNVEIFSRVIDNWLQDTIASWTEK